MSDNNLVKKWYIIHTYSGYEKKVKTDLEKRIETLKLKDIVHRIIVPEEENIELKDGKKKKVVRKLFPGYVMLEMVVEKEENIESIGYRVDSDAWYVIRNTAGVTGFVGVGSEPTPLEEEEVESLFKKIGIEVEKKVKYNLPYAVGDTVTVTEGAFSGSQGKISDINLESQKVKVMIELFGRLTPVEVDFDGVEN
ncbi:MAG: transcription termination/antitermination factor NusG [Fusobacteria bacterium]|jgi:transcriptional antiterminator NusG|nr:transcription termination/antitermination factor NusG [Fusobacteriota bacterium]